MWFARDRDVKIFAAGDEQIDQQVIRPESSTGVPRQ